MNIDYHALLPINGKKFSGGSLTAIVINIPGPTQDSNNVLYLTRFEGSARRMLNLWVAEETLRLNPNAHRDVFKAVDDWLKTDEGYKDAPDRFFDETTLALVPYAPGKGPLPITPPASDKERLTLVLEGLDQVNAMAIRSAWGFQDESNRLTSLIELAEGLPSAKARVVYQELIEAISKSGNPDYQRDKIGQLAPYLDEALLSTLVEHIKAESNEDDRVRLFGTILRFLPLAQVQALVPYARTWGIQSARNLFLSNLAGELASKGDAEQAFTVSEQITDVNVRDETSTRLFKSTKRQRQDLKPTSTKLTIPTDAPSLPEPHLKPFEGATLDIASKLLADIPDEELDLLDFGVYADALTALISNERTQKPLTIGIDAAWGMGKTQLMRMVKKRLTNSVSEQLQSKVKGRTRFPTVWFNAWKYDREDALWAALVLEILDQSTRSLPSRERRSMRIRLRLRRLKPWSLLLSILFLFTSIGLLVLVGNTASLRPYLIALGIGSAAGAYTFIKKVVGQIKTLQQNLSKYLKTPDYEAKIGFLAQFEKDFRQVIDIVTENGRWPLVVFIDDLDRCGPTKAVEIVEAINVLLDSPHCVFVIGMDAKAVAHSIQAKYESLGRIYAANQTGLTLGERFLEKILQINFRIPASQTNQLQHLIEEHLEISSAGTKVISRVEVEAELKTLAEQMIQAEQRGGDNLAKATEVILEKVNPERTGISQKEIREASKELSKRAFEDDQRVREAISEAAPYLDFNPRKVKKFINNFRLHALIAQKRGLFEKTGINVGSLAKAVVIAMRWPDVALSMSKNRAVCQILKDAFAAKDLMQTRELTDANEILKAQDAMKIISDNESLARFIYADELHQILTSMDDSDMDNLACCFQLSLAQQRSAPDLKPTET